MKIALSLLIFFLCACPTQLEVDDVGDNGMIPIGPDFQDTNKPDDTANTQDAGTTENTDIEINDGGEDTTPAIPDAAVDPAIDVDGATARAHDALRVSGDPLLDEPSNLI